MNRAARRAAKRGKSDPHICEHGNWMKTDGTGTPMCPHGCGFTEPWSEKPLPVVMRPRRNGKRALADAARAHREH